MGKRILGTTATVTGIVETDAPDGTGDAILMSSFAGQAKPQWWLLTLTLSDEDDIYLWGAVAAGGVSGEIDDDQTDDVWGLHQDEFGTFPLGHVGTLPAGSYSFVVDGLGLYSAVVVRTGGVATVDMSLTEILDSGRGN